jgi:prepilin-type N-terminal cleavage/methylation domain-containing protein
MKRGFGLVEVMVALVVIAIFIVAVTRMYMASTRVSAYADNLTYASALGHTKLLFLKALPYDARELDAGWHRDPGNPIQEGGRTFYLFWSVLMQPKKKEITVYAAWNDRGQADNFGAQAELQGSGCAHVEFRGLVEPVLP